MVAPCKLALLLTLASYPLLAQSTWQFRHTTEELTLAPDESLQVDRDPLQLALAGNGIVSFSFVGKGIQLSVNTSKDVLLERSAYPTETLFTIITKRSASGRTPEPGAVPERGGGESRDRRMEGLLQPGPPARPIGLPKPRRLCHKRDATRTKPQNLTFQPAQIVCPDQARNPVTAGRRVASRHAL